jgi:hypothetical protein
MCGPKFRARKVTREIRDSLGRQDVEAALAEKARKFREENGEAYPR